MINKITRKNCKDLGLDFDEILEADWEINISYEKYRKGSNFFTRWVLNIDEDYCKEIFPDHLFLTGLWETNTFIVDANHGYNSDEIDELIRVEKIEKTVTTTVIEYKKVEEN